LLRPFLAAAAVVSLLVTVIAAYVSPRSLRELRDGARRYGSELHDRLATPLYPLAFVILAYAFLGPPQTTRQSRTLALLGMIGAVALLRLIGFVSVIVGVRVPSALALQYVALFGAMAAGLWQISRGRAVEPAAAISRFATAVGERLARAAES
jgi:lipopolysaccharide export system permease protein